MGLQRAISFMWTATCLAVASTVAGSFFGATAAAMLPFAPLGFMVGAAVGALTAPGIIFAFRNVNDPGLAFCTTAAITWCLMPLAWLHESDPPIALLLSPFVYIIIAAIVGERLQQRSRTPAADLCHGCGYPLTGLPEPVCPECGVATPPKSGPFVHSRACDCPQDQRRFRLHHSSLSESVREFPSIS